MGRQRTDLDAYQMLLFALVRAIEVIGEAASKVSAETRTATPSTPRSVIISTRNRSVHAYCDIDRNIVWKTVTELLQRLSTTRLRYASIGKCPLDGEVEAAARKPRTAARTLFSCPTRRCPPVS